MIGSTARGVIASVVLVAIAAPTHVIGAQDTAAMATQNARDLFRNGSTASKETAAATAQQQRSADPTLTSPTAAPATTIQLNASTQGQKTVQVQAAIKPIALSGTTFFQASAKATAPLDTANTSQDLLDLTGLTKSTSVAVTVGLNGGWKARWDAPAQAACLHFWKEVHDDSIAIYDRDRDSLQGLRQAYLTRAELLRQYPNTENRVTALGDSAHAYLVLIDAVGKSITTLDNRIDPTKVGCAASLLINHYKKDQRYAAVVDSVISAITITDAWVIGAKGTLGTQDASHTDSSTLKSITHQATTYGISAGAGRYIDAINGVIAIDFVGSQTFKAASAGQLCTQEGVKAALHCVSATLQAPKKQNHSVGSIELREAFSNVALNPELDYDFRTYAAVVKLPIYVFKSASGGLSGGVTFGQQLNQTHQFTLEAFIGNAFSLLKIPGT